MTCGEVFAGATALDVPHESRPGAHGIFTQLAAQWWLPTSISIPRDGGSMDSIKMCHKLLAFLSPTMEVGSGWSSGGGGEGGRDQAWHACCIFLLL